MMKDVISKKAKENQLRTTENRVCQISDKQAVDTKKELAKIAGGHPSRLGDQGDPWLM
ncbi:hypothetical protein [Methanoculleus methanifontis]|uniref:hypothetical protein n=1 Tax=Methanoculleus methanifontis TaxID=2584086 RepID=UPI00265A4D63|nr:hypothetical protein [Methanoculleus sp. FWC-SCC3]